MIENMKKSTLIKRVTYAGMALIMSAVMLFSESGGLFPHAASRVVYGRSKVYRTVGLLRWNANGYNC